MFCTLFYRRAKNRGRRVFRSSDLYVFFGQKSVILPTEKRRWPSRRKRTPEKRRNGNRPECPTSRGFSSCDRGREFWCCRKVWREENASSKEANDDEGMSMKNTKSKLRLNSKKKTYPLYFYMQMEYCEGCPLSFFLQNRKSKTERNIITYLFKLI